MKRGYAMAGAIFCAALFFDNQLKAQTNIPANTIVTQNFNGMGSGLPLPANWKVSAPAAGLTSTWATGTVTVTQAANSGSPVTGGAYNWGTSAGTDRAVGFLASGAVAPYGTPNAVMAHYQNTTGATVTSLTISFAVELYRVNTADFNLSFFSATDAAGAVWNARTDGDISAGIFAGGAPSFTFSTPQTIYKTVTITGLNIANNSPFYLRWVFTDAPVATAQGLGLDNVSVFTGAATPVVTASLRDLQISDNPPLNQANSGDDLRYTTVVRNTGSGDALNVVLTEPAPTNTTLIPGSVKTSASAKDESYTTTVNTVLNVGAPGVLNNDYGIPSPTVASFGPTANSSATAAGGAGTSDNGGTVTVNADGSFSYTPPSASFAGTDKFSYKATNGNAPDNDGFVTITIGSPPAAVNDAYNVIGNVQIQPNAAQGLFANDGNTGQTVVAVNGSAANVGNMFTTANGSNITVNADGSFTYNPGKGFDGPTETFTYTVNNGFDAPQTAIVTLNISGMIWFINNTLGAPGDGRLTSPFNTLAGFQAVNNGAATNPAAGDYIFLYSGTGNYTGGVTLLSNQKLIGAAATATLASITGYTVPVYSMALPATLLASPSIANAGGNGVVLNNAGTSNLLRGFTITNSSSPALSGATFGTLTVSEVIINTNLQALALNTGALSGSFSSVSAAGGLINMAFTSCTGSLAINGGTCSGAGSISLAILGGSVNITTDQSITNNLTTLTSINNGHTGTITFQTGTLSAGGGNGIQFDNADGTYNFFGTTTLNGGDAGIDILNGSGGAFNFATTSGSIAITSPTGTAFNVNGPAGTITYDGNITQANNAAMINIAGGHTGTINFVTANNLTATNGTGLQFDNADGVYNFNATSTLNGGDAGIDILNGSGGTFNFPAGISITNPTNQVIRIDLSSPNFTYGGGFSKTNNANIGIQLSDNTGTININGSGTKTLSTQTANAISMTNNTGAAINFSNNNLLLTTTSGVAFNATGGGTIQVTGTGNTITTTSGTCINLNATDAGAGGINFASLTTASGRVATMSSTGGIKTLGRVQQTDANGSAGLTALSMDGAGIVNIGDPALTSTIKTTTGTGISFPVATTTLNITGLGLDVTTTTGRGVDITGSTIAAAAAGLRVVTAGGTGVHAISGGTSVISGSANTVNSVGGIALNVSSGTANFTFQNVSASGGTVNAIAYNSAAGTSTIGAGTITGNGTAATFLVSGGTASITYSGGITQAANAAMVSIGGGHTGTITFNTGSLIANNGTGIQFDNADGTYNFNGTTTMSAGGDAGIDLSNGCGGTFSFPAGISITNPTNEVIRIINSTANFTYGGGFTKNNNSNSGISITGNTGGTIAINGSGTKTLSTGTGNAVNLTTNGGTAINFSNNNLALTTTTGTGFNATGGGTISVAGTGNTINSTSGATALNVVNTTIGASNINFLNITSSGGSATGIILDNTGSTGKLVVTGTGTTDGSGGTISNKTGADGATTSGCGIYLNSTSNPTFSNMNLFDFQNYGIRGLNVAGFVMTNCDVTVSSFSTNGTTAASDEGSIYFGTRAPGNINGLTGTATITNCLIRSGYEDNLLIFDNSGTLNLTIDNCIIRNSGNQGAVTGNDGVLLECYTSANITADIKNSQFIGNGGDHFQAIGEGGGTLNIQFGTNGANTCTGGNPVALGQSIVVGTGVAWSGTATVNISNNSIVDAKDTPININIGGTGTCNATVSNNTIGTSGIAGSGTVGNEDAIRIVANGDKSVDATPDGGTLTAAIRNNTIQQVSGRGIYALGRDGGTAGDPIELNLTITGNILRQSPTSGGQGIRIECGASSMPTPDRVKIHADIGGAGALANIFSDDWGTNLPAGIDFDEIRITHTITGGNQFILTGFAGNGLLVADVASYLTARNSFAAGGVASASLGGGNSYATGGTPPQPLLMAEGGVAMGNHTIMAPPNMVTISLNQQQLDIVVSSAMSRWSATGLTSVQLALLRKIRFEISDLSASYLGSADENYITVDRKAGGKGWFIGSDLASDAQFNNIISATRRYTEPTSAPAGRLDLLTTIMHEMGHRLGLDNSYSDKDRESLMYGYLTVGERRLPTMEMVKTIKK